VATYVPDRGDLVKMSFSPQRGHEQAGWRPALVVSPRIYNAASSLALFCPITSHAKGYPFEVALPGDGPIAGVVLADQLRSLDWRARRARVVAAAPRHVVDEVLALLEPLVT
jgi:mRNA interferase MazF